jgi:CspA family cold shock protein
VIELSGVIKWFNAAKGYGFIVPDNGMSDVFLGRTCLRRDGFGIAQEGTRVVVEALRRPRGLQAFRILSMDQLPVVPSLSGSAPQDDRTVRASSGLEPARVKWFNRLRGFGFLTRGEGTPDIFVHIETLRGFGLTELIAGQFVLVRSVRAAKGMTAIEVRHGAPLVDAVMH